MAFTILAGGANLGSPDEAIETYSLDATVEFSTSRTANVSSHPIESGSLISDHVSISNTRISIKGVVSVNSVAAYAMGVNNTMLESVLPALRVQQAHDILTKVFKDRKLVTVRSELEVLNNCIITNLTIPRRANLGDAFEFTMELEQVQLVDTELLKPSSEIFNHAAAQKRMGAKTGTDPLNGTQEDKLRVVRAYETTADAWATLGLNKKQGGVL